MGRVLVLGAVVALLTGVAHPSPTLRRQIAFARFESSLGVLGVYDVRKCGAVCTSYTPRVYVYEHGRFWREVTPPHMPLQIEDVFFATPRVGWLAAADCSGGKAFVYRTTDGGRSWHGARVSPPSCAAGSRLDVSFADTRDGWLLDVSENANFVSLERTRDGGRHWRDVNESLELKGSVTFATARDGWLTESDFLVPRDEPYVTHDGGRTWRRRRLELPPRWRDARKFPLAPTFFGRRGVFPIALVDSRRTAIAFYTTQDTGRTWRIRSVRDVPLSIVGPRSNPFVHYPTTSIPRPAVWWIAGSRGRRFIAVTRDAGASWQARPAPASAFEISAAGPRRAWVTTSPTASGFYATRDGGRTWHRVAAPRSNRLHRLR